MNEATKNGANCKNQQNRQTKTEKIFANLNSSRNFDHSGHRLTHWGFMSFYAYYEQLHSTFLSSSTISLLLRVWVFDFSNRNRHRFTHHKRTHNNKRNKWNKNKERQSTSIKCPKWKLPMNISIIAIPDDEYNVIKVHTNFGAKIICKDQTETESLELETHTQCVKLWLQLYYFHFFGSHFSLALVPSLSHSLFFGRLEIAEENK